ncbi:MAG TPA: response regulator transcription factor [Ferruginibacter sp.]|nr:response regulator transcription factor [Ferruginibacter sp.]HRE63021.1 response regulator transcription factor [Ferruginibacter sp.]
MITVAIVDDQEIILNGLQKILTDVPNIQVIAMYNNGDDLLNGLSTQLPDVLLLDIQMPERSGIELAAIIAKKFPSVKMIALTNVDVLMQMKQMLQKGCLGYLLKDVSPQILISAIETVYTGEQFLNETLKKQLLTSLSGQDEKQIITRREKEILKLILEENTNQEIANKLFLSLRTVENHRNNLLQKLNVKNTAGLVKVALQEGLV